MSKFLLLCFSLTFCYLTLYSQEDDKSIHLLIVYNSDSLTIEFNDFEKLPVPGIITELYNTNNSSTHSAISNEKGKVTFHKLDTKLSYYINFKTPDYISRRGITIKKGINIELVNLDIKSQYLEETIVISKQDSVLVKEDTLSYNANSFRSHTDENVSDILKKLPGTELINGKLSVEGDKVTSILLDGEEYFKSNENTALEQIPSDIISRIEIIDIISPDDPSQQSKIINIVSKKKEVVMFSKIALSSGTKNRYRAAGNYFIKSEKQRLTVMGDFNNINKEDLLAPKLSSLFEGDNNINGKGVNYVYRSKNKLNFDFNYYSNNTNRNQLQESKQYLISAQNSDPLYILNETNNTQEFFHSIDLKFRIPIRKQLLLKYETNGNLLSTLTKNQTLDTKNNYNNSDYSLSSSKNLTQKNNYLSQKLSFNYKFKVNNEKKIVFKDILFSIENSNNFIANKDTLSFNYIEDNSSLQRLTKSFESPLYFTKGILEITNKIGANYVLKYNISSEVQTNKNTKYTLSANSTDDFDGSIDSSLSTVNNLIQQKISGTINVIRKVGKTSILFGISYQSILLKENFFFPENYVLSPSYNGILPILSYQFKKDESTSLRITYSTHQNAPSFNNLNPLIDNSIPTRLRVGNSDLKPEFEHLLSIFSKRKGGKKFLHILKINSLLTTNYTGNHLYTPLNDSIILNVFIKGGAQFTRVESFAYKFKNSIGITHEKNIAKNKFGIRYELVIDMLPNKVNNETNFTYSNRFNFSFFENYYPTQRLSLNFRTYSSYARVFSSVNTSLIQSLFNWNTNIGMRCLFWKSLLVDIEYSGFQAMIIGSNYNKKTVSIVNISVKQGLFKNQKASVFIKSHDLLNQNTDITQNPSDVYITNEQKLMLGRYFLVGFALNL
jgi:hypothetical protein